MGKCFEDKKTTFKTLFKEESMDKYIVIEKDDLENLSQFKIDCLNEVLSDIRNIKKKKGKVTSSKYLIINKDKDYVNNVSKILSNAINEKYKEEI